MRGVHMMKNKLIACMGCLIIPTVLISGCTTNGTTGNKTEVEQTNTELSIWVSSSEEESYEEVFEEYRDNYPNVKLDIQVYDDNNYESEKTKMNTQLMAGEGPDLLFLGIYGIEDVNKMMQSGIFASLTDYVDNDESYNKSDYTETVMDAGKYNGEQYVIPLSYASTYFVSSKEALAEYGITQYEYNDYFSFMEMMASMYSDKKTERILADSGNFDVIKNMGIDALDYEKKEVNIDTDDVKRAYELYKSVYEEDTSPGVYDNGECILERKAVIRSAYSLSDAYNTMATIGTKETPVVIALPTVDGQYNASISNSLAVRANSANKQNAWNMIKLLLESEGENELWGDQIPVNKAGIDNAINSAKESVDLNVTLGSMENYEIPEDTYNKWIDIVTNVGKAFFNTSALGTELADKMEPYLKDDDSYENCMKKYVTFANIYISE